MTAQQGPIICRCIWHGVRCEKEATQEDGLCDWCGVRTPEDMRDNPFAIWHDGQFQGLGGGSVTGYNHQAGWGPIPEGVRPTACWMEPTDLQRINRSAINRPSGGLDPDGGFTGRQV